VKRMSGVSPTYRSDEKLEAILQDTAVWAVKGRLGTVLAVATCLHDALARLDELSPRVGGDDIITQLPGDRIIIYPTQIRRLLAKIRSA
jgi:hypothetical protein